MDEREKNFIFGGFQSPNFTPVPDEFFDFLLTRLSGAEIKVLLYVIRRTFGFKKRADRISKSQLENGIQRRDGNTLDEGAGLSRRAIRLAIDSLVEKRILVKKAQYSEERGHEATEYALNVIGFDPWVQNTQGDGKKVSEQELEPLNGQKVPKPLGTVVPTQETVEQENNVNVVFSSNGKNGHPTAFNEVLLSDIVAELRDKNPKSRAAFIKVINILGSEATRQLLSLTNEAHRRGQIRGKKAPYFIGMAKNIAGERGLTLGFGSPLTRKPLPAADPAASDDAVKKLSPDLQAAFRSLQAKIGNREAVQRARGHLPQPTEV